MVNPNLASSQAQDRRSPGLSAYVDVCPRISRKTPRQAAGAPFTEGSLGTDGLVDMKHISGIRTAGIRDKIKRAGKCT